MARHFDGLLSATCLLLLPVAVTQACAPDDKDARTMTTASGPSTNRLRNATSPYLQQHAHNPVDWYEWGSEALARARRENKPIFLSIGYAACHWCHVMAHESFENPDIAAVMNESFVSIKVDREERPDLDEIYMQATLALNNGNGGWPMSVWLTPDLKPFYAGTYFPPTSRWGRPGFKEVCQRIAEAWQTDHARILEGADQLTRIVRDGLRAAPSDGAELTLELVDRTADQLSGAFDADCGGMLGGSSNKFPPSMALDVMLRSAVRRPADDPQRKRLLQLLELTLDRMATGGIYDQLGGGFHRYSTDRCWHVPHFEKMLYDQALISRIYLDAYQFTHKPLYECIARETFDYVLGDLQSPEGGFYSTRDADSEGEEGKYYVWTRAEVLAALGPDEGTICANHYDISESGNWHDPHDPGTPKSIPRVLRDTRVCAKLHGIDETEFEQRILTARAKLLQVRAQRTPPALDDKILCEWNGMMIASLARGGCVLGEPRYIAAAARAADFILQHQYHDGHLQRSYRAGRALDTAFLSDYSGLIEGLLELYEATFDPRWLTTAEDLNRTTIKLFWDADDGGFFFTPPDHEDLIARSKDVSDGAVPSGNSVQVMNLLRLSAIRGDPKLRDLAERTITAFAGEVERAPWSAERFLTAVEFAQLGPVEVAIVGDPTTAATRALLTQVYQTYLPNRVLALQHPAASAGTPVSPLFKDRPALDGQPTVYVCRNSTCQRPVTAPKDLAAQLAADRR